MARNDGLLVFSRIVAALVMLAVSRSALAEHVYRGVRVGDDFDRPLTFRLGTELVDSETIWAVGEFDVTDQARSDRAFQAFLDRNKDAIHPGMTVVFHSPGGNPIIGFAIGRLIREHGLNTSIGQINKSPKNMFDTMEPGLCASSCAFAFLGGVNRKVPAGSLYGVHDINLSGHTVPEPLVFGQQLGAMFTDYMREMGVDTRLGVDAANYNSANQAIHWLTPAELARYRVTTGVETTWQIEQVGAEFPLIGATASQLPPELNRLTFYCERDGAPQLLVGVDYVPQRSIFLIPQNPTTFSAEVQSIRLVADPDAAGDQKPALDIDPSEMVRPLRPGGQVHVNMFLRASSRLLDFITAAKTLRVQFNNGQVFRGGSEFFDTDVAAGRTKITAFAATCH